jgi:GATA-binding protein, other eukaryote
LSNDNRLPPMASYPSPTQRHSSLSPNSFLSPSRKRSFSATEIEPPQSSLSDSTQPKRLSSIKSILNPGTFSDSEADRDRQSPGRYPGVGSPLSSGYTTSPANSAVGSALNSAANPGSESERAKLERREMLQREAEKMREALKAKERELAELGMMMEE